MGQAQACQVCGCKLQTQLCYQESQPGDREGAHFLFLAMSHSCVSPALVPTARRAPRWLQDTLHTVSCTSFVWPKSHSLVTCSHQDSVKICSMVHLWGKHPVDMAQSAGCFIFEMSPEFTFCMQTQSTPQALPDLFWILEHQVHQSSQAPRYPERMPDILQNYLHWLGQSHIVRRCTLCPASL